MNTHHFPNLGAYLHEFLRALNASEGQRGRPVFAVQVLAEGLAESDAALLR